MITSADIASSRTRLGEGFVDSTGVYWVASPPVNAGRTSLYCLVKGVIQDVTPDWDLRTSIHDYGGTAVCVRDGRVVFYDRASNRVWAGMTPSRPASAVAGCEVSVGYVDSATGRRRAEWGYSDAGFSPITPGGPWRWGGFEFLDDTRVVCVREDRSPDLVEANDALVVLDIASDNPDGGTIIVQGADFYWTPTVNALGDIAWMEYDHPDMGWTHTRIVVRTVSGQVEVVWDMAGVSAVWPQWDADGSLVFLADESGYWTFHRWRDGVVTRLHDHRFDFCEPPWVLSRPPYALLWDGAIGCTWWADSLAHVGKLLPDGSLVETLGCAAASVSPSGTVLVSGRERTISEESLDDTPRHSARSRRTHLTGVDPASCDCAQDGARRMANEVDEDQWLPARPMSVASLSWDDQSRALCVFDWEDGTYIPLVQEYEASNSVDNAHDILSSPENVEWKAETGEAVHGWFYPAVDLASTNSPAQDSPCDPHHAPDSPCEPQSAQDSLLEAHHRTPDSSCEPHSDQDFSPSPHPAPLLVLSHSGPTLQATSAFSLVIQYFTTHGIGVLDVNYSGSAGFGRAYRDRLNGTWGVVDVSDCVDGAEEMVRRGVADPDRLAIMGSSAGGFTTLAALTSSDIFKAGVSMYGIADLEAMTLDPVKLESHYNDWLIGPYPEQADLFRDRSPIHHLDKLNAPMLILQGEDDPVVAPSQAQAMYNAVLAKGLEAELVMYSGEGHGFRQPATIQDAYTRILEFLTRVFDLPT